MEGLLPARHTLQQTATGLDNIPAWFLRIGAPFYAAPIADMMNLLLSSSVVPRQWKSASIPPIAKAATPLTPSDFRPTFIIPVLYRLLEYVVVKDFIYLYLNSSPPSSVLQTSLPFTVTNLLDTNSHVNVYALDFSKAFNSVRHSTLITKYAMLNIPDNIFNRVELPSEVILTARISALKFLATEAFYQASYMVQEKDRLPLS